jgi:hypothetical protein
MELLMILLIICGAAAAIVANSRGASSGRWFVLGCFFGPLGLLFSFASGDVRGRCQFCRSTISAQATRCPRCQADSPIHVPASQPQMQVDARSGAWPAMGVALAAVMFTLLIALAISICSK